MVTHYASKGSSCVEMPCSLHVHVVNLQIYIGFLSQSYFAGLQIGNALHVEEIGM